MQNWFSCTVVFQSRSVLDAISTLPHAHFSIKECSWCNSEPLAWSFFNQEVFLMQFWPSCTVIFQSRSVLDAIPTLLHGHFSIKDRSWCNFVPLAWPFFNQGAFLMQFRASRTLIFQSRIVLDAILCLLHGHFSIKECSWCNSDPLARRFFNQGVFLMQFRPSRTPIFQSRIVLDAILPLPHAGFSIKNHPGYHFAPLKLHPFFTKWLKCLSTCPNRFSIDFQSNARRRFGKRTISGFAWTITVNLRFHFCSRIWNIY